VDPGLIAGLAPTDLPVVAGGRVVDGGWIELPAQGALVLV
jgi:hypothetical protein